MATTEADICNRALLRIGSTKRIADLDDTSTEGLACNTLYPQVRDEVLAAFPWPFAAKRQTLAPLSGVTRDGWGYAFEVPVDCIAPRYVFAGVRPGGTVAMAYVGQWPTAPNPDASQQVPAVPFAVESDDAGEGRLLLCDSAAPQLVYTARITAPPAFPPLFVNTLAWRLAAELALAVSVKPQFEQQCMQRYYAAIAQASAAALRGQQEDAPADAKHIAIRE